MLGLICGVDEAGRGPWAGPVVAAAVILSPGDVPAGLADSKTLSKSAREALAVEIRRRAKVGLGSASVEEIDDRNILQATLLAMRRAVMALPELPAHALIDGNRLPVLPCSGEALIKGDARCPAISAASIIAKTVRDKMMADLARAHPGYGWEHNAGYGTAEHRDALVRLGVTIHHRRSFKPVREHLESAVSP